MSDWLRTVGVVLALVGCSDTPENAPAEESAPQVSALEQHETELPQVFPDMGPGEAIRVCEGTEQGECDECSAGSICAPDFCGGQACAPGYACYSDADCSYGACVRLDGAPPSERGLCTPRSVCAETRDCALGFRCESGACVDRRIPCGFHSVGCPRGLICSFVPTESRPICVTAQTPCEHEGMCEPGARCVDVDGDGRAECSPAGACSSNADCAEGFSCGVDPGTSQAACVVDGACRGGECPGGFECIDTGVGRSRCVRSGECARDAECPPGSICGAIDAADRLRCLSFDEEEGHR